MEQSVQTSMWKQEFIAQKCLSYCTRYERGYFLCLSSYIFNWLYSPNFFVQLFQVWTITLVRVIPWLSLVATTTAQAAPVAGQLHLPQTYPFRKPAFPKTRLPNGLQSIIPTLIGHLGSIDRRNNVFKDIKYV